MHALKARLGEDDSSEPPPTSTPPDQTSVIQLLRSSLTETTASRDELLQSLATSRSSLATLQARVSDLEDETEMLTHSRDNALKLADDEKAHRAQNEETIAMLRVTVEEARRGVMRLQAEKNGTNKRVSSNPMGMAFDAGEGGAGSSSRLGVDGLPQPGGGNHPPSSFFSSSTPPPTSTTSKRDKRQSLNVGHGLAAANGGGRVSGLHRRVSSISDSAVNFTTSEQASPPPTNKAGLRELRLAQPAPAPPVSSGLSSFLGFGGASTTDPRRVSALSAAGSNPPNAIDLNDDNDGGSDAGAIEESRLAAMRKLEGTITPPHPVIDPAELVALRTEMSALQSELVEAREAREASESACRALREFIAAAAAEGSTQPGEGGMLLPPLPSDMDAEEEKQKKKAAAPTRGWTMGGLFNKKEAAPAAAKSAQDTHTTPIASPNLGGISSPNPQDDAGAAGGAASNSFVSSWSRSVSQAGATSPSPPSTTTAATTPAAGSRFSFFSSKPVVVATPPPVEETPPTPPAHDEVEAPDVPQEKQEEALPALPERSSLGSPPPASIPETAEEETEPSTVVSVDGEAETKADETAAVEPVVAVESGEKAEGEAERSNE